MQDFEIIKYLNGSANDSEQKKMENWILASDQNSKYFNEKKALYIASTFDETSKKIEIDQSHSTFAHAVRSASTAKYRKLIRVIKYAAMIAVILGTGYFYKNVFFGNKPMLTIPDEAVTLQLNNGDVKIIDVKENEQIVNTRGTILGIQAGSTLNYKNNIDEEKLTYNTLTVPYGKQFEIILSDGTRVKLNAGTSIKYPVRFIKNNDRKVFLKGEAFFDVSKDETHPFIVNANDLNVRVLGTKFNISSYPEDENINTVLVEGSVGLFKNGEEFDIQRSSILDPGHKATWNKNQKNISIEKVDISIYTAWAKGKLVFKNTPFKIIRKKLERHYNVSIVNNDKYLDENTYSAVFDIENTEKILQTLNESYKIQYTIINNQIVINPSNNNYMK